MRISGHKREEVSGVWRKLDHVELHNFYCCEIKSRKMRRDHLEILDADWVINLKSVLNVV
jgi:hypothetical protein